MPDGNLMICVDVNVLVHAANVASPRHSAVRAWLTAVLASREPLVIPDAVTTGFVRIVTNSRIMPTPLHPDEAFALVDWILGYPRATSASGDVVTRIAFRELVGTLGLRGNDIPDAWIAATALSTNATLATFDRGFRRFPGLQVIEPSA
jgi:toxin-antitoxin system PIN domain toxin